MHKIGTLCPSFVSLPLVGLGAFILAMALLFSLAFHSAHHLTFVEALKTLLVPEQQCHLLVLCHPTSSCCAIKQSTIISQIQRDAKCYFQQWPCMSTEILLLFPITVAMANWREIYFSWFITLSQTSVSHATTQVSQLHASKQTRTDVLITTRQICKGKSFCAHLYSLGECVLDCLFTNLYLSLQSHLSGKVTSQNLSP